MRGHWKWAAGLFMVVFLMHGISPNLVSNDSRWTMFVAQSLLDRRDVNIDEYPEWMARYKYYSVECVAPEGRAIFPVAGASDCPTGSHYYSWYPIAVSVLAAPLVAVMRPILWMLPRALTTRLQNAADAAVGSALGDAKRTSLALQYVSGFLNGDLAEGHPVAEAVVASFIVALTAAVLFLIARRWLTNKQAAALTLVFAFCTPAWSSASRGLWQHGPSMLMLSLSITALLAARERPNMAQYAGLPLAISYAVRPTNAIAVVLFSLCVFVHYRKQFLRFLFWASPVAALFIGWNWTTYHTFLPSYYRLSPPLDFSMATLRGVSEALAGNLISPSRGLLIFTPLVCFVIYGMWRAWRDRWAAPLGRWLVALIVLHWVSISLYYPFWWGGHSYGPRLWSDMSPLLVLFLVPAWKYIHGRTTRWAFAICLAVSFLIHARGATQWRVNTWNALPVNVDQHPERVWDWRDPQFLRDL